VRCGPGRLLGCLFLAGCGGCAAFGGVAQAGMQIVQLALSLAAMALPFLIWYYYHRHQD